MGLEAEGDQVALKLGGKDDGQLFKGHKGKPGQAKDDDNGGHSVDEMGPKHHGGYQAKDQGTEAVNHERQGALERGFSATGRFAAFDLRRLWHQEGGCAKVAAKIKKSNEVRQMGKDVLARRGMVFLGAAALLSACVGGARSGGGCGGYRAPDPAPRAVPNAGWDTWVEGFKGRAASRGISSGTIDAAFRGAGFIPEVIERDRNQTEFTRTLEDYLNIAASDERVLLGRQKFAQYGSTLQAVESRYGVEGHVVAAVWGLESFFGTRRGNVPVISALSTLAYDGRRGEFFESQLVAALKILQAGDVSASGMVGSWAGAMGHTQFIPTSYLAYAVDFTGDGRRDIWGEDPTDSLASTAAYLAKSGWTRGLPWGMEVVLPAGFDRGLLGRGNGRSAEDWASRGVRSADGRALAGGSIIAGGTAGGAPHFLLTQNFATILRYNNAQNYAIGVGHLSDRLLGRGPVQASFGPDASGMTKADRQELQRLLTARGFDTEGSDGVIGAKTKAAISAYQASIGVPVTGEPSLELLRRLR